MYKHCDFSEYYGAECKTHGNLKGKPLGRDMPVSLLIWLRPIPACDHHIFPLCEHQTRLWTIDGPKSWVVFLAFPMTSVHSVLINLYRYMGWLTCGIGSQRSCMGYGSNLKALSSSACCIWGTSCKSCLTLTTNLSSGFSVLGLRTLRIRKVSSFAPGTPR